jgi:hypothetical protein
MAKAAKKGDKSKKEKNNKKGKDLSPLEKARLARAKGGKGKNKKAKKNAPPTFKPPEEFKPFFFRAAVKIAKDGFPSDIKMVRIKGSLTNENAKTVDMSVWDPQTYTRFCTRYGVGVFATNQLKRLPAGMMIKFAGRVSVKSSTGGLNVGLKEFRLVDPSTKKGKEIGPKTKEAPIYRLARKPAKFLAAAFVGVKPFPTGAELKAMSKESEDDGKVKVKSKVKAEKKAKKSGKKK